MHQNVFFLSPSCNCIKIQFKLYVEDNIVIFIIFFKVKNARKNCLTVTGRREKIMIKKFLELFGNSRHMGQTEGEFFDNNAIL